MNLELRGNKLRTGKGILLECLDVLECLTGMSLNVLSQGPKNKDGLLDVNNTFDEH